LLTQLLFRQTQVPNLKDFSFNERSEKAVRHALQRLKNEYLNKTNDPTGAASNSNPSTPKGKRKADPTEKTGSSAKRAKQAAKDDSEPQGIKEEPNDEDYDSEA
jgi:hypothetical protein